MSTTVDYMFLSHLIGLSESLISSTLGFGRSDRNLVTRISDDHGRR